jgi:predicted transcriptional regulator
MAEKPVDSRLLGLTAQIVAAHAATSPADAESLPSAIRKVYGTLAAIGQEPEPRAEEKPIPAVPIRKSIFPDYIVCLEDGKQFKTLKRHLATTYNMTPAQYRSRWGLDASYPMVAPNYAETRSTLAKKIGLGTKRASAE